VALELIIRLANNQIGDTLVKVLDLSGMRHLLGPGVRGATVVPSVASLSDNWELGLELGGVLVIVHDREGKGHQEIGSEEDLQDYGVCELVAWIVAESSLGRGC